MDTKKLIYGLVILCFAALSLTFRPGLWLVHKSANTQSERYVKGWEEGCISGTNSYTLLFAPLLDHPFVKEAEDITPAGQATPADKANYKSGWNEGFTLCRYYQSSVYELMQFAVVIATLLYIGYLLSRKRA